MTTCLQGVQLTTCSIRIVCGPIQTGFVGLLYVAVEPFVSRHWRDALISRMRMVNGRFRDLLVTSHILRASRRADARAAQRGDRVATNDVIGQPRISLGGAISLVLQRV